MGERSFNRKVSNPEYTPDFYDLYGTTGPQSVYNSYNNSAFLSGFSYNGITYRAGKYQDTELTFSHIVYLLVEMEGLFGRLLVIMTIFGRGIPCLMNQ